MGNRIHPTAIIGEGVELGDNNVIGPYAVIVGPTTVGSSNWIAPHVVIGTPAEYRTGPHRLAWDGELAGAGVRIGDSNIIREFITINQGTHEATVVGNGCYLLARTHIGHDCVIDNAVTLSDAVQLGGHTHVWSWANIGMGSIVHQRGQIGPGAMVGMASSLRKPAEPFMISVGHPARAVSLNRIGLSRLGCSDDVIDEYEGRIKAKAGLPAGMPAEVAAALTAWSETLSEKE
jgi:UDP-N-acetylglucosamine acyltransferase